MGIRYKINESFFKKWNWKAVYVLGYIYADGSLENSPYIRGKYLRVSSIDRSTIVKIKKWLDSEHKIVSLKFPKSSNRQTRYVLRIGSYKLYEDLIKLGLYPNKSLTVKFPDLPKEFLNDFIRGYFDGDGCVYIDKGKKSGTRQPNIKRLLIVFTSGSLEFLKKLSLILKIQLDLNQIKVYKSRRSFQLRYSTNDSIRLFKFLYSNPRKDFCLERKLGTFLKYFHLRPGRIDKVISDIFKNYQTSGAVAK